MNSISCRTLLDTQDLQSSADGFRWQPLLQQQNGQTPVRWCKGWKTSSHPSACTRD